jgi:hypothetical protein
MPGGWEVIQLSPTELSDRLAQWGLAPWACCRRTRRSFTAKYTVHWVDDDPYISPLTAAHILLDHILITLHLAPVPHCPHN